MHFDLQPSLPPEIIELILGQVDNASLKNCSLVSSTFRPYAHRRLFRHLHLSSRTAGRIVGASFPVRSSNNVTHLTLSWDSVSPYWLCKARWLPPILKTLVNVESISLLGMGDSGPDWWNLPGDIQEALRALFRRPCLTRVVLENISFDDVSQLDNLFQGSSLRDLSCYLSTSHQLFENDDVQEVQEVRESTDTPFPLHSLALLVSPMQLDQMLTYLLLPNNVLRLNQLTVLTLRCTMYALIDPATVGVGQLLMATRSTLRHITFVHNRLTRGSRYSPEIFPLDHLKSLHFTPTSPTLPFSRRVEFAIEVLSHMRRPCQLQSASLHLLPPSQRHITLSETQQWIDKLWDSVNGMASFHTMTLYLIPSEDSDPTILTQLSFPPGLRIESQLPSTLGFTFDIYSPLPSDLS